MAEECSNSFLQQQHDTSNTEVAALRAQLQILNLLIKLPQALEEAQKRIDKAKTIQDNMAKQNAEVF